MKVSITLASGLVIIEGDGRITMNGKATSREAVAVSLIHSVVTAECDSDFDISRLFTVGEFENYLSEKNSMVCCKWTKHGYIKKIGPVDKCYKHANSIQEALERVGVFTCMGSVFSKIPKRRCSDGRKKEEEGQSKE